MPRPRIAGSQFRSGSAWHRDRETGQYYLGLFSAAQPDMNWQSPQVRGAVKDVLRFWADMGVDGFRLDVISLIAKPEDYPAGEVNESGFADFHPFVANNPRRLYRLREEHQPSARPRFCATGLCRRERGLHPAPGFRTSMLPNTSIEGTGELISDGKNSLKVALKGGYLSLDEVQLAGKKRMPVADLLRGTQIENLNY